MEEKGAIQPIPEGTVTSPQGFAAAATACGLKASGRPDLGLLWSERPCCAAGVFTRSQVVAAPVVVDRETLREDPAAIRAVVTNAGAANACTGEGGLEDARRMQELAAAALGCGPGQVLVLSTGVIGARLDMAKVAAGTAATARLLVAGEGASATLRAGGDALAHAMMTTDTVPKQAAVRVELGGGAVTVGGVAKGSGMIHPDMATMLAVLTTDAAVTPPVLDRLLRRAVDASFHRISVDGDTSTNDTVLALANGATGVQVTAAEDEERLLEAFIEVAADLARRIVRDGEGATRFVTLRISGAESEQDALKVARTIATSPLVKTALAGGDPNWGRILAAAGRAGVPLAADKLALTAAPTSNAGSPLGPLTLVRNGCRADYPDAAAAEVFAASEITLHLDLGQGTAESTFWTTDLTSEYVRINADYRT